MSKFFPLTVAKVRHETRDAIAVTFEVPRELKDTALDSYRTLLDSGEAKGYGDPEMNDPQLSFQLAQAIQDTDFQTQLLRDRSEASRLRQIAEFLKSYVPRIKQTSRMQELAPKNGFGHHPVGI